MVAYASREDADVGHEHMTRMAIAAKIAALKGFEFEGEFDPSRRYKGRVYFVPSRTMVGHKAVELGICNEDDLFGGVVPYAFVGTKTITHPLVDARAYGPPGWSAMFAQQVRDVVLDGVSELADLGHATLGLDVVEHVERSLVGAAVRGPPQACDARGDRGKRVRARRRAQPHGGRRRVLLVVGVQDEDSVDRAHQHIVDLVVLARRGEHHPHEVCGVRQSLRG